MPVIKLTKRAVDGAQPCQLPDGTVRQVLMFDPDLHGFGLCVGAGAKSYFVQREVNGRSTRMVIGKHGVLTPDEARRKARRYLADMSDGKNPIEEKRKARVKGFTLRDALVLAEQNAKAKGHAAKTVGHVAALNVYLKDWLTHPLAEISRTEVRLRHVKLQQDIAKGKFAKGRKRNGEHGKETANKIMRTFRTVYNLACREHPELPSQPCLSVNWFKTEKPKAAPLSELHKWAGHVNALTNSVRRDYLRFTLHTGLRRKNASEAQWSHVDFERRILHVPYPKTKRPFDLPLTEYLMELLQRRKKENAEVFEDSPWIFPAESESGHIAEPRAAFEGITWKIHDLRRWFITCAESLDLSPYVIKALANHSLPAGDVTAGYLQLEVERLRPAMEAISERLHVLCTPPENRVVSLRRVVA